MKLKYKTWKSMGLAIIFIVTNGLIMKGIIRLYIDFEANIWTGFLDLYWTIVLCATFSIFYYTKIEPNIFYKEEKENEEKSKHISGQMEN